MDVELLSAVSVTGRVRTNSVTSAIYVKVRRSNAVGTAPVRAARDNQPKVIMGQWMNWQSAATPMLIVSA